MNTNEKSDGVFSALDDKQKLLSLYAQGFGPKAIVKLCGLPPVRQSEDRVRRLLQVAGVYKPKFRKSRRSLNLRLMRVLQVAARLSQPFMEKDLLDIAWPSRKPATGARGSLRELAKRGAVRCLSRGFNPTWEITSYGQALSNPKATSPEAPQLSLPPAPEAPLPPPPPPPPPWAQPVPTYPQPAVTELMIMQMLSELDAPTQSRIAHWLSSRTEQNGSRRR